MTLSENASVKRKYAVASAFLLISLLFGCAASHLSTSGQNSHTLSIAAVGDTNGYNTTMQAKGQLKSIEELLSGKDILIFNAEGVFSEKIHSKDCHRFKHQSLFLSSLEVIDSLPRGEMAIAS